MCDEMTARSERKWPAGVEHSELLGLSKPLLESLPKEGKVSQPASKYLGGDFRCVLHHAVDSQMVSMSQRFLFSALRLSTLS